MKRPAVLSLFSGAAGLDYGFEAAGFKTAGCVELDARCVLTLRASRPDWPVIDRDIATVATDDLLRRSGLCVGEADVLIGGPPCQPFSKAGFWATGEAKRLADPRASTLDHYLRILEETQPKAFLLENVEGLGFRGKDEGLKLIHEAIANINARTQARYTASVAVLNAVDYGVPQLRRRLFVIGSRDGRTFRFPNATHTDPHVVANGDLAPRRTAWDALWDMEGETADQALALQGKWADLMPSIPEGENYLWHTSRGGGEPLFGWRRRYWSFLLKLAKDQPSWTLAAQPGPATGPFHWSGRRLSVREMARLQTFPADALVKGSLADAQRQLGNAVPSLLAEVLARAIAVQLLDRPSASGSLRLAVPAAPTPPPPPPSPSKVPARYLALRGDHDAHPGTGKGFGAIDREQRRLSRLQAAE